MGSAEELQTYLRSIEPDYIMTTGPFVELGDATGEPILSREVQREGSSTIGRPETYYLTRLTYPESSGRYR